MTSESDRRAEATSWFARLQSRSVTTGELAEFAKWRSDPANASAYRATEALWDGAGKLKDDTDVQASLQAARGRRRIARWWSRPLHRWLSLGAGAMLAGLVALLITAPSAAPTWRTATGERSFVRLDDGTGMQLDTDTIASASIGPARRVVHLDRGQAYFDVRHDPARPFVVEAAGVSVTALGTRFDVDRGETRTRVSLIEGSVEVRTAGGNTLRLRPGESVVVSDDVIARPIPGVADDLTSWREGRLTFRETPLTEAVASINRYTDREVRIEHASIGAEPISGDFAVDDIDGFVRAVETLFGHGAVARSPAS